LGHTQPLPPPCDSSSELCQRGHRSTSPLYLGMTRMSKASVEICAASTPYSVDSHSSRGDRVAKGKVEGLSRCSELCQRGHRSTSPLYLGMTRMSKANYSGQRDRPGPTSRKTGVPLAGRLWIASVNSTGDSRFCRQYDAELCQRGHRSTSPLYLGMTRMSKANYSGQRDRPMHGFGHPRHT
jgi:hypothetical protein